AGAAWGFGWGRPETIGWAQDLLFSLGVTRFSLTGAHLSKEYRLEDDIPAPFRDKLAESVVFHSFQEEAGPLESLRVTPWRALVYEAPEPERFEDAHDLLKPFLTNDVSAVASTSMTDGEGRVRSITILLRR